MKTEVYNSILSSFSKSMKEEFKKIEDDKKVVEEIKVDVKKLVDEIEEILPKCKSESKINYDDNILFVNFHISTRHFTIINKIKKIIFDKKDTKVDNLRTKLFYEELEKRGYLEPRFCLDVLGSDDVEKLEDLSSPWNWNIAFSFFMKRIQ